MNNLNRDKVTFLVEKYINMIENGVCGNAGSGFFTVRELSNIEGISPATAQKVFFLLEKSGVIKCFNKKYYLTYEQIIPNSELTDVLNKRAALFAKELIGILVPEFKSPFFATLVQTLSFFIIENGYFPIIMSYQEDENIEKEMFDLMVSMGVKGILSCPNSNKSVNTLYLKSILPVVYISKRHADEERNYSAVDNYTAAKQVAKHLVEMGYEYFMYIGIGQHFDEDKRYKGFYDQLSERGIDVTERCRSFLVADYYKELPHYIRKEISKANKPLGIFCYHDIVAEQVLVSCKKNNLFVPSDVGIVGFDNLPLTTHIEPAITTVAYSFESMAKTAVKKLLNRINGNVTISDPSEQAINHMLIIRNSSRRKK